MAIADFVLPTEEVQLPDGKSFAVRGISLEDVTILLSKHGAEMDGFYQQMSARQDQSAMEVGLSLIGKAPDLVANIIAMAADEPALANVVKKFTIGVQQDALEKIAKLTFDASGGPGKFIEAVTKLVQATGNLTKLPR